MTCDIYIGIDGEYREYVLEHELEHCKGKDHIGGSILSDDWAKWKKESK